MTEDYNKAYKKGKRAYQNAVLSGKYPFLPALDDILQDEVGLSEMPVGLMEIPIEMVAGTKTRGWQEAFSCNFMPILGDNTEFAMKWAKLYDAQIEEGIREAVKVYEYMWQFYVLEGNKRVSVLKYLDVPYVMADVTRILPRNREDKEVRVYYEFLDFFNVAPIYGICFTEEGSYERLAEILGRDLKEPWPEETVHDVTVAFTAFSTAYREQGGDRLRLTEGDAFLLYLTIFRFESLLTEPKKSISRRISRIWNELRVEANDSQIAFLEQPELEKKEALIPLLRKKAPVFTEKKPLKLAFIYDRNPKISSWTYGHELGRNHLEDCFEQVVVTEAYTDCSTEDKFWDAVNTAVDNGARMIFTISPLQMEMTLRAAIHYPDIKFMNCSINLSHSAVRTYYGRMYEAKFLMGALAATMTDNHRIGYVADYPMYGSMANINAFAIGAAFIDPRVKIHLTWTSLDGQDWHRFMDDAQVQVLSGPDLIKPQEASREYGIYMFEGDKILNIAAPMWDWGKYYELIVRTIFNNTWPDMEATTKDHALNYWWGMSAGVIDVILSDHLPYYSRKLVDTLRNGLLEGKLNPFSGELRSQDGTIRNAADSGKLINEEIVAMDWLNDNIIGSLPKSWELNETGKKTARISGMAQE